MSVPIDELAANLLATLHKPSVPSETKLAQLNSLKSSIKHQRIPDSAQYNTVECIRAAIASQTSSSLVAAGFSSLSHLVKRLALQEHMSVLFSPRIGLIPTLLERLGDSKEQYRTASSQAFCDIWPGKQLEVEKAIREGPLTSGNARAKLMAMEWVTKMHQEQNLQFRSFVSPMVACLEDADGTVRESAKLNLVELFRGSRDGAKADLKKQLIAHNVRKSIANYILSQLGIPTQPEAAHNGSTAPGALHRPETPTGEGNLGDLGHAEPSLPPSVETAYIEPMHVYSARELEDIFRQMQPSFEDKEKEDNWKPRDNNVLKLRRLLKGNAPVDYHILFISGIKALLDGIFKVVLSLRTTLSTNGCQFVQEFARTFGPAIDSLAEIILHALEKMCSATKNIAAQNANTTTDVVLSCVSYNIRQVQHIWAATNDKNVQPRIFACSWLQTVLRKVRHNKSQFDHSGGLDLADKCVRKGLSDANPKVRESMRGTYWVFAESWPDTAAAIMATLDVKSKQMLEKDSGNPNASDARTDFTRSVGPDAASNPRLATSRSRASLKEHIAAQKKAALAARRMPDRPNSAMSTFTPIKEAPTSARRGAPSSTSVAAGSRGGPTSSVLSTSRHVSTSSQATATGHGSLMSAPMRRPRKADIPRPATADPYASGRDVTPPLSPREPPVISHTKSKSTSAASAAAVLSVHSSRGTSPRTSPVKQKQVKRNNIDQETTKSTNVLPRHVSPSANHQSSPKGFNSTSINREPATPQMEPDRPGSGHSSVLETMEEDNFTLVIPEKSQIYKSDASKTTKPQLRSEYNKDDLQERPEPPLPVFEDPVEEPNNEVAFSYANQPALEEVHPNGQNSIPLQPDVLPAMTEVELATEDQERPISPKKGGDTTSKPLETTTPLQDRSEILKTRRLLLSGIERVRAKSLDAHGFRRLQDLVRNNEQGLELQYAALLEVLLSYLQEPNSSLRTTTAKATALKLQALSTARAVIKLCPKETEVYKLLPTALVSFIPAVTTCESSASHLFAELERAAEEVARLLGSDASRIDKSVDLISNLAELDSEPLLDASSLDSKQARQVHARKVSLMLNVLSKLVSPTALFPVSKSLHITGPGASFDIYQRLAQIAVKFLASSDADVRRHAMDFTVVVYSCFATGVDSSKESTSSGKIMVDGRTEFWKILRAVGEQQCNLVAYYIARKEST